MIRPRQFISYARADKDLAKALVEHLEARGCDCWLDTSEILVGDDFVRGLQRELARCDGLVFLLTPQSAASSWCQAEVQRALALGLPVAVLRREAGARLPDAMERLLRDTQHADWPEGGAPTVGEQISAARGRRRRQRARRWGGVASAVAVLGAASALVVTSLDRMEARGRRIDLLDGARQSALAWSGEETRSRVAPVSGDPQIRPLLQSLVGDATASPIARHNAWQATAALGERRQREWRAFVPEIQWSGGRLSDAEWSNTSYARGSIRDLVGTRLRMAGLVFGPSPAANRDGMSLLGVRIRDSDAWFLRMDGTQLIDVELLDTKLRGAQLDLTGAGGVRFRSSEPDTRAPISADVGIIEDSWIVHRGELPGPGVMDLAEPEQEVLFEGIQFARVRFEGNFKPGWFRDNFFSDCIFATNLTAGQLEGGGNRIEGGVWLAAP